MPISKKFLAYFDFDGLYHIYNRSNDGELLFHSDANRYYFLKRLDHFLSPYLDVYAWNLLPNHFHLVVRVKHKAEICRHLTDKNLLTASEMSFLKNMDVNKLIYVAFKRFFTSYAMAFNKLHNRKGNLFHRRFKRVYIEDNHQLTQVLIYVHTNAQKHGLTRHFTHHKWTSYHSILSSKSTKIPRHKILEWFGGEKEFLKVHSAASDYYFPAFLIVENEV